MKRIKPGWPNLVNDAHFSTPADPRAKHGRDLRGECPLRNLGCYAYEDAHLGTTNLRSLSDFKGRELIARILALMDQYKPLHLSIVGGDPLVRYRELDILLPQLVKRAHIQGVTSAFSPIPLALAALPNLQLVVSVDGLQPQHDVRRKPATYERILRNIQGHHIAVHCTIAMVKRSGYIPEFVDFLVGQFVGGENLDEHLHTPARRSQCRMPHARRAEKGGGHPIADSAASEQVRHARRDDQGIPVSSGIARPVYLRPERAHALDRLEDTCRTLPVWRQSDCSRCGCIASMGCRQSEIENSSD